MGAVRRCEGEAWGVYRVGVVWKCGVWFEGWAWLGDALQDGCSVEMWGEGCG